MSDSLLTYRLAGRDDLEALKALMDAVISQLQKAFLDVSQIASSRVIMGLDSQLIDDGTYFILKTMVNWRAVADGVAALPCMGETRPLGEALISLTRRKTQREFAPCIPIPVTPAKEWGD